MATWQLQTAKAKLSELLRAARDEGPQVITVRGKEEFVVMRKADDATVTRSPKPKSLWDLLEPVRGLGEELERNGRGVRESDTPFDDDEG